MIKNIIRLLCLYWFILLTNNASAAGLENYTAYKVDVDNDGILDILLEGSPKVILIHGEIVTPIVTENSPDNIFIKAYSSAGDYALPQYYTGTVSTTNATRLNSFQGNFNNNIASKELLIQASGTGQDSLIIAIEAGSLTIHQNIDNSLINGMDISAQGSILAVKDINGDGIDELSINNKGLLFTAFADSAGQFSAEGDLPIQNPTLAGTIEGQFSVNEGGSASYAIPLEVPPGTAGMEPSLSLNFNSQPGNGLMGVGWSLGGLSAISRCPATKAQDGFIDGVDFDSNDRFCLDGQRLIAVSGAYGANGTQYRTELDGYSRIISYGQQGQGPQYFKVWTKSGLIMEFGVSADSRIEAQGRSDVLLWNIGRVRDTLGNYYQVSYYENNATGVHYPDAIDYTGNDTQGILPVNTIDFVYENRLDTQTLYRSGSKLTLNKRLAKIILKNSNTEYLNYTLVYNTQGPANRSYITKILQCSSSLECINDSNFIWQHNASNEFLTKSYWDSETTRIYPSEIGWNQSFQDMNGDGRLDHVLAYAGDEGSRVEIALNTGSEYSATVIWDKDTSRVYPKSVGWDQFFLDMNGDGLLDHVLAYAGDEGSRVEIALNTGSGFAAKVFWDIDTSKAYPKIAGWSQNFQDMDGDGLLDHVLAYAGYDGSRVQVALNTGSGFNGKVYWNNNTTRIFPSEVGWEQSFHDMNSDGLSDHVLAYAGEEGSRVEIQLNTGNGFASTISWDNDTSRGYLKSVGWKQSFDDMNGDGLPDHVLAYAGYDGSRVQVALNTGSGFNGKVYWNNNTTRIFPSEVGWEQSFHDMNSDGLSDHVLAYAGEEGSRVEIQLNTGNGFASTISWDKDTSRGYLKSIGWKQSFEDMNSDGLQDHVLAYAGYDGSRVVIAINNGQNLTRLASIKNGYDAEIKLSYAPLTNNSVYTKGTGASYPTIDIQAPINVIYAVQQSDGLGGYYKTNYKYSQLRINALRGSQGFAWIRSTDTRTGISTRTDYHQEFPLTGLEASTQTRQANGKLLSWSQNSWQALDSNGAAPYQLQLLNTIQNSYELDGSLITSTQTDNQYDAYGNTKRIAVSTNDGFSKITENSYANDAVNWFLGRLNYAKVTSINNEGVSASRESSFAYDPLTGLLTKEIIEPYKALGLITEYQYDGFGNKIKTTVSGTGITTRSSRSEYDAQGRFPVKAYNALNHMETRSFDPNTGKVLSLTGPNGLTTTWEYDPLGRKTKEFRADGTVTEISYANCKNNCGINPLAFYAIKTHSSGSQPGTTYYDQLGREITSLGYGFDGRKIIKHSYYNNLGQVYKTTLPFFEDGTIYESTRHYDLLGRLTLEVHTDGSQTQNAYDGLTTTTTNHLGQITVRKKNSQGKLIEVIDNDYNFNLYRYDAFNNLIELQDAAGNLSTMSYDIRGRKIAMNDPDMGAWQYQYDVLGKLTWQKDAKGQESTLEYDLLGRMSKRTEAYGDGTSLVSQWQYDSAANGIGKLHQSFNNKGYSQTLHYDNLGRPSGSDTQIDGGLYSSASHYDQYSRVIQNDYPGGLKVSTEYNEQGFAKAVRNAETNEQYGVIDTMDAQGHIRKHSLGNGLSTRRVYNDSNGYLLNIMTGVDLLSGVQYLEYEFDALGNLTQRRDSNQNLEETFAYDGLNRLTSVTLNTVQTMEYRYDAIGNLTFKSDVGDYVYGAGTAGPHAVTSTSGVVNNAYAYDANGNQTSGAGRTIGYTGFNKPLTISKDGKDTHYKYDTGHNRISKHNADKTIHYLGKQFERIVYTDGRTWDKSAIEFAGTTIVVNRHTAPAQPERVETRYLHKDHLGSTDAMTDETAQVLERFSYDAHGQRRQVNWTPGTGITSPITRGFTGHEMEDELGLVNMNARLYDPSLGRFIQADSVVQTPDYTQGLNRYSYVNNNPLSYTDPTGHFLKKLFKGIKKAFKKIGRAVKKLWENPIIRTAIGLVVGFYTGLWAYNTFMTGAVNAAGGAMAITGSQFASAAFTGKIIGGAVGGFTAGYIASGGDLNTAGIGALAGAALGGIGFMDLGIGKVAAHGFVGGVRSELSGGKFKSGFLAGAFGEFGGGGNIIQRIVVGGTAAVIGGGKFANGAFTAAFNYVFNYLYHEGLDQANRLMSFFRHINMPYNWTWHRDTGHRIEVPVVNPVNGQALVYDGNAYIYNASRPNGSNFPNGRWELVVDYSGPNFDAIPVVISLVAPFSGPLAPPLGIIGFGLSVQRFAMEPNMENWADISIGTLALKPGRTGKIFTIVGYSRTIEQMINR